MRPHRSSFERNVAVCHGLFWVASGLWPILHLRSFERVTGPKPEGWLVKTVGSLIAAIGGTVAAAGLARRITPEIRGLAIGSALALTAVDLVYPAKRRISPVYLLDGAVELAIAGAWGVGARRAKRQADSSSAAVASRSATAPS